MISARCRVREAQLPSVAFAPTEIPLRAQAWHPKTRGWCVGWCVVFMLLLAGCASDELCWPRQEVAASAAAPLYAWWTPNAFPLQLVNDTVNGCPDDAVQAAVDVWAPLSGGFEVSRGRFREGDSQAYAHIYLRRGQETCKGARCYGHTDLRVYTEHGGQLPRGMHGSMWVDGCDPTTLAHELGHALGLDDVDDPAKFMDWAVRGREVGDDEAGSLAYGTCEPSESR